MKILIKFITCFVFLFSSNFSNVSTSYYARNYIVIDAYSQEILEGKDYNKSYSVASISKIMTAIIAIESDDLFKIIEVDDIINTIEGSSLYLSIGDKITIIDLVYGLMLRSGNDAAVLIAKNISGSIESFVELMNQKALEIGMINSHFNNPSGLDINDEGNISSCLDMAILMSYCLQNELFCQIINTKSYYSPIKGNWINKNKLLHGYEYCLGGKTGYTKKARRTLITVAEKDYQRLIVVTFDCGNDFNFHKSLYEHYFNNYQYLVYLFKGENYIDNYCIYSNNIVGIRIDSKIKKGIKLYYINPIRNTLNIQFVYDEQIIKYEKEFNVTYRIVYD